MGLDSFYHLQYNEVQGKETVPTFYFHYDRNKAYHIDYFFGRRELLKNIELGSYEDWVADGTKRVSDHVPLVVDLNIS
jgi:endonuclease/exonuclease/phosphatase family metal-dependent hydrolase